MWPHPGPDAPPAPGWSCSETRPPLPLRGLAYLNQCLHLVLKFVCVSVTSNCNTHSWRSCPYLYLFYHKQQTTRNLVILCDKIS